jgi:hypothetical protein
MKKLSISFFFIIGIFLLFTQEYTYALINSTKPSAIPRSIQNIDDILQNYDKNAEYFPSAEYLFNIAKDKRVFENAIYLWEGQQKLDPSADLTPVQLYNFLIPIGKHAYLPFVHGKTKKN